MRWPDLEGRYPTSRDVPEGASSVNRWARGPGAQVAGPLAAAGWQAPAPWFRFQPKMLVEPWQFQAAIRGVLTFGFW
jgi:hypothetical protein